MVVEIRKRFDRDHFQVWDQSRFTRVHFRDEHLLVSIGTRGGSHRQDSARMTNNAIERQFADDDRIFNNIVGKMSRKHNNSERDGQIVGGSLFADGGGRQIDDNAMAGEMQTGILNGGLHTFTTLLHGRVWKPHNCYTRKTIGVIHFDFNDNAFETDDGTGKNSGKHYESLDEEE